MGECKTWAYYQGYTMPSTLDLMVVCVYLAIGASIFLIGALLRPWLDGLCLRKHLRFDGSEVSRKFAHIS